MSQIEKIDPNFKLSTLGGHEDVVFYNCLEKPFQIYGLIRPEGERNYFVRIPEKVAENSNEGVVYLNTNTAGGRVRFRTNSPYVAIRAEMHNLGKMPHFAFTGSIGFDLYIRKEGEEQYVKTFVPPVAIEDGYESLLETPKDGALYDYTVNFPLYSGVKTLYIGLQQGAQVEAAAPYRIEKPVVYYGSSITQGGCASRPGNAYQAIITRRLDCDHINLGFSGSARGETAMAEYIAGLPMSAFVMDYDYNAPTVEHLRNTHERMYQCVRAAQPGLPIILVSCPDCRLTEEQEARREVIRTTYRNALEAGDRNVYFIDGSTLTWRFGGDSGTVDGCHPNDLGFMCMALGIGEVIQKVLVEQIEEAKTNFQEEKQ